MAGPFDDLIPKSSTAAAPAADTLEPPAPEERTALASPGTGEVIPFPKAPPTEPPEPPPKPAGPASTDYDLSNIAADKQQEIIKGFKEDPRIDSATFDPKTSTLSVTARTAPKPSPVPSPAPAPAPAQGPTPGPPPTPAPAPPGPAPAAAATDYRQTQARVMNEILTDPQYVNRPDLQKEMLHKLSQWAEDQRLEAASTDAMSAAQKRAQEIQGDMFHSRMISTISQAGQDFAAGKPVDWDGITKQIRNAPELVLQGHLKSDLLERIKKVVTDPDGELKKYGPGFSHALTEGVWSDPADPKHISSLAQVRQLYAEGRITLAGEKELAQELLKPKTLEGGAEAELKKEFLKNAHIALTQDPLMANEKIPGGEEQYQKFMAHFLPIYDALRQGLDPVTGKPTGPPKTASQLLDPASPDYLGKDVKLYQRSAEEYRQELYKDRPELRPKPEPPVHHFWSNWFASAAPAAPATAPAPAPAPAPAYDPASAKSLADLQEAVRSGQIAGALARKTALERGWIQAGPQPPAAQ